MRLHLGRRRVAPPLLLDLLAPRARLALRRVGRAEVARLPRDEAELVDEELPEVDDEADADELGAHAHRRAARRALLVQQHHLAQHRPLRELREAHGRAGAPARVAAEGGALREIEGEVLHLEIKVRAHPVHRDPCAKLVPVKMRAEAAQLRRDGRLEALPALALAHEALARLLALGVVAAEGETDGDVGERLRPQVFDLDRLHLELEDAPRRVEVLLQQLLPPLTLCCHPCRLRLLLMLEALILVELALHLRRRRLGLLIQPLRRPSRLPIVRVRLVRRRGAKHIHAREQLR